MSNKISKERLIELSDEVRAKVQKDFADQMGKIADGKHTFESFSQDIIPRLISEAYISATLHSEVLIYKALEEVGLTTENNDLG